MSCDDKDKALVRVTVLLYSGRSWLSKAIRWQTRSRYSHAALKFGDVIIEAIEGRGVIQRLVGKPEELADEYYVSVTSEQEFVIRKWVFSQVGRPYDWPAVLRFLSRRRADTNGRWFCSELVFAAFLKAGIHLLARTESWEVSPGLLARSPLLLRDNTVRILACPVGKASKPQD